jgi:dephospho-CoA kinase
MLNGKPIIGIAGGIGSGKSTVGRMLADLGCIVTVSDDLARAALEDDDIRETLVLWWGAEVLDAEGAIDRSAVGRIVFADERERRRLENLTHPWIERRRLEAWSRAPGAAPAYVIDAPLLFEAGLDCVCDAVAFVHAERPRRLARTAASRGWDEAELAKREDSQMPLDDKRAKADYVIENNDGLSHLESQVRRMLSEVVETHRNSDATQDRSDGHRTIDLRSMSHAGGCRRADGHQSDAPRAGTFRPARVHQLPDSE